MWKIKDNVYHMFENGDMHIEIMVNESSSIINEIRYKNEIIHKNISMGFKADEIGILEAKKYAVNLMKEYLTDEIAGHLSIIKDIVTQP